MGVVRDAVIAWALTHDSPMPRYWWSLPVVAETWDGWLNDINGFHVSPKTFHALETRTRGAVEEGGVGGGTGMICNGYKGGIGTASRVSPPEDGGYTVGVLVQCNYGRRPNSPSPEFPSARRFRQDVPYAMFHDGKGGETEGDVGSIIIVVATDAPLLPGQLKRLAKRATMGLARTGSTSGNGSGDIFIAFSTANPHAWNGQPQSAYHPDRLQ